MHRRVDQSDYRGLMQAKRIIDNAFSSDDTDWLLAEQMDLHDASAAVARLLDSLRQETPVGAIAARIVTAAWQDRKSRIRASERHHVRRTVACSTCGCGFSYGAPMRPDGFQEGDRVRRKSDGMEGTVDYVGSGPKGDSLSVLWDNLAQQMMGPDIIKPGTVEKSQT